jgi:hypothetical protein
MPIALKERTSRLSINPADVSVDANGNVVIKDASLAAEFKKLRAQKGAAMSDICCGGCACSPIADRGAKERHI